MARRVYVAVWLIIGLTICSIGAGLLAATDLERATSNPSVFLVLQEEIAMLKWIGLGICTTLSGAVAVLWRALVAAQKQSLEDSMTWRQEAIALTKKSIEVQTELKEAVGNLQERIAGCPHHEE